MPYSQQPPPFDPVLAERSRAVINCAEPLILADPASIYLAKVRGIPTATFMPCTDLKVLMAPIPGRPATDHACVSLLRPAPGAEPTGAELAFVDVLGHPSATAPARVQWRFVENGCRDAWFWAGGSGGTAYVAEGFLAKPLAILSLGLPGMVMGWGARSWLQFKTLPPASIKTVVIVEDRRPS
jgi:hypothetical protein